MLELFDIVFVVEPLLECHDLFEFIYTVAVDLVLECYLFEKLNLRAFCLNALQLSADLLDRTFVSLDFALIILLPLHQGYLCLFEFAFPREHLIPLLLDILHFPVVEYLQLLVLSILQ